MGPMEELDDLLPRDLDVRKKVEEAGDGNFDPLPSGWYSVCVERAEIKETKAGGRRLSVGFVVEGEKYSGRWVFGSYNLKNQNPEAVKIAVEEFSRLCVAVGISKRPKLVRELEGCTLDVRLVVERDEEYGDRNVVKGYAPFGSRTKTKAAKPPSGQGFDRSFDDDDIPF